MFGSLVPPGLLLVPVPDAVRGFRLRSPTAVPGLTLRLTGTVLVVDVEVSRTTVRSLPRKSENRIRSTITATAMMPQNPPGKVRVVLVVVVTSVAVPVTVVPLSVGAAV